MKKVTFLLILTSIALINGCSKKDSATKEEIDGAVVENPKSHYGKKVKKAEDAIKTVQKNRAEDKATIDEFEQ